MENIMQAAVPASFVIVFLAYWVGAIRQSIRQRDAEAQKTLDEHLNW